MALCLTMRLDTSLRNCQIHHMKSKFSMVARDCSDVSRFVFGNHRGDVSVMVQRKTEKHS